MQAVDFTSLQMDEYFHLAAAESFLNNERGEIMIDKVNQPYDRGFVVTLLAITSVAVFGGYNPWAVLPMALINAAVSLLLYSYLRRYSKAAGLLAAAAWAFAPLALALGAYLREYSVFLFIMAGWSILMLNYIRKIVVEKSASKTNYRIAMWLFLFPLIYLGLEFKSTFGSIIPIYVGLTLLTFNYYLKQINIWERTAASAIITLLPYTAVGILFTFVNPGNFNIIPMPNWQFFEYFLQGKHTFAAGISPLLTLPISLAFVSLTIFGSIVAWRSKRLDLRAIVYVFVSYLIFYGFYFNRYFEERYYVYIVIWSTLLIAIALAKIAHYTKKYIYLYAFTLFAFTFLLGSYYFVANNFDIKQNALTQKVFHTQRLKDYTELDNLGISLDSNTAIITPTEHIVLWHFSRNSEYSEFIDVSDNDLYWYNNSSGSMSNLNRGVVLDYPSGYFIIDRFWLTEDVANLEPVYNKRICFIEGYEVYVIYGWGEACK